MASRASTHSTQLVVATDPDGDVCAALWPRNRRLGQQLDQLLALWPGAQDLAAVTGVVFCPDDWLGAPSTVTIRNRRYVTTYVSPRDDSHLLTLFGGGRPPRHVQVVPHDADPLLAEAVLASFGAPLRSSVPVARRRPAQDRA